MQTHKDTWMNVVCKGRSDRDQRLLDRASRVLEGNICPVMEGQSPPPWHPLRGVSPSLSTYQGVWNWDSAFHAITIARWDPPLAREQIQIFLNAQQPSGLLPDVIWAKGGMVTDFGKPPVFPWACARIDERAPNDDFLRYAYHHFKLYEAFWIRERGGAAEGLFHYDCAANDPKAHNQGARYESGWDDAVRWDVGIDFLWPIDLNCYMIMLYRALMQMAKRLRYTQEQRVWWERSEQLSKRVEATLWSEQAGAYCDVQRADGMPTGVLTPASFMPLYIGIAAPERAVRMAALATSAKKFFPGVPTVAYDNPAHQSDGYWRGSTWLNTAWFAAKGLQKSGFVELADRIKNTLLDWCDADPIALYEHYNSQTGQGLGAKQFGWTAAFIIEFLLDW